MFACTKDTELRISQLTNKLHELASRFDEFVKNTANDSASLTSVLKDVALDTKTKSLQIAAMETAIRGTAEICTSSSERYAGALNGFKSDLRILSDTLSDMIVRNSRLETRVAQVEQKIPIDFGPLCEIVQGDITTAKKPLLLVFTDTLVTLTEETPDSMAFFNATPLSIEITVKEEGVSEALSLCPLQGVVLHLELYKDTRCHLEDAVTYFGVPSFTPP